VARGTLTLLVLAALAAAVLVGCGAGSGGSSQRSAGRQAPETANSSGGEPPGQKAEGAGDSGQASGGRLGHPALGPADAPVVLTEYGDYQ
jgi:hypothetical protein